MRMPTACSAPPPPSSIRATARSHSGSRSERCSACARSTTRSGRSANVRCASSTRRSARRVAAVDGQARAAGLTWPQSRGSQLAGLAVGARAGERTLDLCAAPGGKATQLEGEVVAVELHPGRARELEQNCRRLGADNVTVVNADATQLPPELAGFDRVLVDAPCSGLGVLAGRPDLRLRARPLPGLPLVLLRVAAERVQPGGTITYSVRTG